MTGLIGAIKSKYPPKESEKKSTSPSNAEVKKTLEWFEKVEAARAKKQGSH